MPAHNTEYATAAAVMVVASRRYHARGAGRVSRAMEETRWLADRLRAAASDARSVAFSRLKPPTPARRRRDAFVTWAARNRVAVVLVAVHALVAVVVIAWYSTH